MPSKSWKNHLKKLLTLVEIPSFQKFFITAQTAKMADFMFQNMAYRATVYRTGILSKSWEFFEKLFGNFMEFFGSLLRIFWEFFGNFWEEFLWGIFWEEFFGKKVLEKKFQGGFFRRTIFGRINFGRKFLGGIICLHYLEKTVLHLMKSLKMCLQNQPSAHCL